MKNDFSSTKEKAEKIITTNDSGAIKMLLNETINNNHTWRKRMKTWSWFSIPVKDNSNRVMEKSSNQLITISRTKIIKSIYSKRFPLRYSWKLPDILARSTN